MKTKAITSLPYLLTLVLDFYLLPCLIRNTGSAMLFMLAVMPLVAFSTAAVYGVRHGFWFPLSLAAGLLFLPSVFLFYNASAWGYCLFYAGAVLAGNGAGRTFFRRR